MMVMIEYHMFHRYAKAHEMMASIITILLLGLLVLLSPSTFAEKGKTNTTPHRRRLKSLPWISKKRQYYQHTAAEADPKSPLRTDDTNNNVHVPMIVSAKSGKVSKTTKSSKGSKKYNDNKHPSAMSLVHSKSAKVSAKFTAAKSSKAKSSKAKVYKPYYSSVESDTGVNEDDDEEENEEEQSTSVVDTTPEITTSTDNIEDIGIQQKGVKTLYIVRHAEHERECNENNTECEEWLRPKGIRRADEIANYMKENDIINKITHVFATHRPRTYLTVLPVAELADVNVTTFPKDAEYSVNQVESVCPTLNAIRSTPMNSTIVVAGHGGTIYKILSTGYTGDDDKCDGLGLDTSSNQTIYPKDDYGTLPEDEYSNLWKVSIDAEGSVKLDEHVLIDPPKLLN